MYISTPFLVLMDTCLYEHVTVNPAVESGSLESFLRSQKFLEFSCWFENSFNKVDKLSEIGSYLSLHVNFLVLYTELFPLTGNW